MDEFLACCPAFNALYKRRRCQGLIFFPKCLPAEGKIAAIDPCETSACFAGSSTAN